MEGAGIVLTVTVSLMMALIALGIHVGVIMVVLAAALAIMFGSVSLIMEAGLVVWPMMRNFVLTSLPLFILMGEILVRSGLSERLYWGLDRWFRLLPGGLLHTNIAACAGFAAISGSSVATAATIGTVALPAFQKLSYDERLVLGTLAAGGTLGILIPPSIAMIMYGLLTDTSIGRLFIGGIIPGVCLAAIFMLHVAIATVLKPEIAGGEPMVITWTARLLGLVQVVPALFVVFVVLGSLYFGFATPTEAAALGVVAAVVLAVFSGRLDGPMLHQSLMSTGRTLAMVMLILAGTLIFNFVLALLGVPRAVAGFVSGLPLPPLGVLIVIIILYLILGMFIESLPMIIMTLPVIFPIIIALGYDPVWFGVLLVVLMEAALISPPVGLNLYVIQGIRLSRGSMADVIVGSFPFFVLIMAMVGLMVAFPGLVLWLPDQMMK